jgi:UDP-glucose 4-epimerase
MSNSNTNSKISFYRAVVTGSSGFIGGALVQYLVECGTSVVAVDQYPLSDVQCESFVMDITIPGALDGLLDKGTVLFHMAARADVARSVMNPIEDFKTNMCGIFEVLESVRKSQCQLIFPSTASIYDINNHLPLREIAFVKPSSPYAAAKAAGEAYCAAYHRSYGLNIKIARMFSVYGKGMNRFAIHDIIRKIQKNHLELSILGDGDQIRDYLYINDAVRGLVTIAEAGQPGEDYNLASGVPVRLYDLALKIAHVMGYPDIKICPTGRSFPGDVPRWYAEISKICKIGFTPEIFLEEGLLKTIDWLMEKGHENEQQHDKKSLFHS